MKHEKSRRRSILRSPFAIPKPEKLLKRVLDLATEPGDLVLDSFSGSGTTGAVAHKIGCHWIMVELGEHGHTHINPRLKKVIDGVYVTTANPRHEQLQQLSDEVGGERSLLMVCSAFRGRNEGYASLTVKKIPKAVLTRCE